MLSNSVCNHTCDKQIGLPLRGRPSLLSLVWLQTELDSTQSYYHYLLRSKHNFFLPWRHLKFQVKNAKLLCFFFFSIWSNKLKVLLPLKIPTDTKKVFYFSLFKTQNDRKKKKFTFFLGLSWPSGSPGYPSNVTLSPGTLPSGGSNNSKNFRSSDPEHMTMACDVTPLILWNQRKWLTKWKKKKNDRKLILKRRHGYPSGPSFSKQDQRQLGINETKNKVCQSVLVYKALTMQFELDMKWRSSWKPKDKNPAKIYLSLKVKAFEKFPLNLLIEQDQ